MSGVVKLCQRRLYSWLSSRCGLPICIVGTILLLISILQFGEVRKSMNEIYIHLCPPRPAQVLLQWSKEKYEYQFSIYADNIAGKSYER